MIVKHFCRSDLRVGLIAEEFFMKSLEFEFKIFYLTKDNWKETIKYANLDFILIESFIEDSMNIWNIGSTEENDMTLLKELLEFSQTEKIKTVFWITKDRMYDSYFVDLYFDFDHVYCSDIEYYNFLKVKGLEQVGILKPCVQPSLFNPLKKEEDKEALENEDSLSLGFRGLVDIDKFSSYFSYLKDLRKMFKLNVFDYNVSMPQNRIYQTDIDDNSGVVDLETMIEIISKLNIAFIDPVSTKSKLSQSWYALQVAACRVPILSNGIFNDELLQEFVLMFEKNDDFLLELYKLNVDKKYRERISHLQWRHVNYYHTFSHRIQQICRDLSIDYHWEEYPLVSLVTPTIRDDMKENILSNFKRQIYPNKELIVIANGFECSKLGIMEKEDIKCYSLTKEFFAGGALNFGILKSNGEYCFRIDDDDIYGEYYILDAILFSRGLNIDFFGKTPCPLQFDGDEGIYVNKNEKEYLEVEIENLKNKSIWFGGNTFAGRKTFFKENRFTNNMFGAADSDFLEKLQGNDYFFAFIDKYNVIAKRDDDLENHTWKANKDVLVKKRVYIEQAKEFFI